MLLLLTYFGSILVKILESVSNNASEQVVREVIGFESSNGVVIMLLVFAFTMLLAMSLAMGFSIWYLLPSDGNNMNALRFKHNSKHPELDLKTGHEWMLFLSHVWSSGQE
jgi:hypothetical protein